VWLALSHHRVSLSQEELDALFDKLDSEDKKQRPVPFIPYLTTKLHPYQEQVNDSRTHAVYCPTNHPLPTRGPPLSSCQDPLHRPL
jgi:hypothetical protein